jgi:preprotein translocase subunit Sec61beta
MAQEMSMPGSFGGLMRYKEEYNSKLKISPSQVVLMIIIVVLLVLSLKIFFPIKTVASLIASLI